MRRLLKLLAVSLTVISCDSGNIVPPAEPEMVIEGWIENGKAPVVFVTTAFDASIAYGSQEEIREHIIRYASVTIENNGVTYPLTSNISDDYFLKNYFLTLTMRHPVRLLRFPGHSVAA